MPGGNPIISSLADVKKSQVDNLAARAQFLATIKEEGRKAAEKRMAQVQEHALTAQQAQQKAREDAQQQQQDATQSVMAVMPQPMPVRGDRPGISQSLATSSQGSIGGLEAIAQAVTGGRGVQRGQSSGGGDSSIGGIAEALNQRDAVAGNQLGSNYSISPAGAVTQTERRPMNLGHPLANAFNMMMGAPFNYTTKAEDFDRTRLLMMDRAAQHNAQLEDIAQGRARELEMRKLEMNTAEKLRKEGTVNDVNSSLAAARAIINGDDVTAGQLLGPSKRAELIDERIKAQTRSDNALTQQRLALARKYDRTGIQLGADFKSVPLDVLGGIPATRQNGATRTPNDVSQSFGSGDNSLLDNKGLPRPGKEPLAIDNQRIMFANGQVLSYGVEKPSTGWFSNNRGAATIPLGDILNQHIISQTHPDEAERNKAAEWLVNTKLFTQDKAGKLQTVDVTGGYNDPNASPARGIRNLEELLSTASPEVQNQFLQQFKGGSYLPGQAPKPVSSRR